MLIKRSKQSPLVAAGDKFVTDDVFDFLQMASTAGDKQYAFTLCCILDIIKDATVDLPKGVTSQAALISVTGVIDAGTTSDEQIVISSLVHDAHLLSPAEAEALKPMLVKMFCFSMLS